MLGSLILDIDDELYEEPVRLQPGANDVVTAYPLNARFEDRVTTELRTKWKQGSSVVTKELVVENGIVQPEKKRTAWHVLGLDGEHAVVLRPTGMPPFPLHLRLRTEADGPGDSRIVGYHHWMEPSAYSYSSGGARWLAVEHGIDPAALLSELSNLSASRRPLHIDLAPILPNEAVAQLSSLFSSGQYLHRSEFLAYQVFDVNMDDRTFGLLPIK